MKTLLLAILLMGAVAAEPAALPAAPEGSQVRHGSLLGQPFWARLLPADAQFAGNRKLELVYTPPASESIGGAFLSDCPFLLLDQHLRLVAWNGRDTLSQIVEVAKPRPGYKVTREFHIADGKDAKVEGRSTLLPVARGWDERIAPVLLAFAWRAGGAAQVPCYDLFAPAPTGALLRWEGAAATIAGRTYAIEAGAAGRLLRLRDAAGALVLEVAP